MPVERGRHYLGIQPRLPELLEHRLGAPREKFIEQPALLRQPLGVASVRLGGPYHVAPPGRFAHNRPVNHVTQLLKPSRGPFPCQGTAIEKMTVRAIGEEHPPLGVLSQMMVKAGRGVGFV